MPDPDGAAGPAEPAADPTQTSAPDAGSFDDQPSGESGTDPRSTDAARNRRRRGSRGGRTRHTTADGSDSVSDGAVDDAPAPHDASDDRRPDELPERHRENRPSAEAAERALVRKPRIGDSMPAPTLSGGASGRTAPDHAPPRPGDDRTGDSGSNGAGLNGAGTGGRRKRRRGGRSRGGAGASASPIESTNDSQPIELDAETLDQRRGRERNGRPVGRYLMAVHVSPPAPGGAVGGGITQIAVVEGRALIEHYLSHPSDDVNQIHGNIYLGKVQNVLPGMEAAFIDIGTPKNAVLYRGDTRYDPEDIDEKGSNPRIEQILKARQSILCQVTKNPIAHKGARLTQEVSLPGRFVVLIPNSSTYGISKRLPDHERKRLRSILDKVKPKEHGVIVRTAAEGVTTEEIERDVLRLVQQWGQIEALARRTQAPGLLYREPDMAVRVIREEFNKEYRKVVIDDRLLYEEVRDYVRSISPALEDRVEYLDPEQEALPLLEQFHVHEQLHKALDRKVWLPSGGSLIIEHTEALTVIDVNTGKNVGTSSLEETVYRNNLEAAVEIARQLRLRDIGGIIVIDFVDMEVKRNREDVIRTFRDTLARDKTRTQVFDISELGLVEMTRKRIGEGLLESFTTRCPECEGRGLLIDAQLLGGE